MRGYQKKVIYVKNTGSALFDEAYFVMKDGYGEGERRGGAPCLVLEANRIIEENFGKRKGADRKRLLWLFCAFIMGGGMALLLGVLLGFI